MTPHPQHARPPSGATHRRAPSALTCVRAGLLLVLAWPVAAIAVDHVTTTHTLAGLLDHEVIALVDGTLAWVFDAVNDPLPALAQTLLLSAMTAIALPRHRHCPHQNWPRRCRRH